MTQEQARQQVQARQPMQQAQPVRNNLMNGDVVTAMREFLKKSGQPMPSGTKSNPNPNPMNVDAFGGLLGDYPQSKTRNPMYDPFNPLDNSPAVASPMGTTGTGGGTTQSANPLQSSSGMGLGASNAAYMAKGGKVKSKAKVKKYAKGGSVSSASKRADGCATKGKTKGRIY
jgi:hypothetical protein